MGRVGMLVVFFLTFNLWAGLMMSTGASAALGIDTNIGGDDAVDNTVNNASKFNTGAPTGSTLFGLYNVLGNTLTTITDVATAGSTMLVQAGLPGYLKTFIDSLMAVTIGLGLISWYKGWDI